MVVLVPIIIRGPSASPAGLVAVFVGRLWPGGLVFFTFLFGFRFRIKGLTVVEPTFVSLTVNSVLTMTGLGFLSGVISLDVYAGVGEVCGLFSLIIWGLVVVDVVVVVVEGLENDEGIFGLCFLCLSLSVKGEQCASYSCLSCEISRSYCSLVINMGMEPLVLEKFAEDLPISVMA